MVEVLIANKVLIRGLSEAHRAVIKRKLTLKNPMFHKMVKMGKKAYGIPKEYIYYEEDEEKESLYIPRGMRGVLLDWLKKCDLPYKLVDQTTSKKITRPSGGVTLRDYQVPIVEQALKEREGMIVMGTGTGKTIVGIELIKRHCKTATILVPNNVLLGQFVKALRDLYKVEPGIINGDEKRIGNITVATFQSLNNRPEILIPLATQTSVLIVDECQSAISDQRAEVLKWFGAEHVYGLTATPKRSKDDGRTEALEFFFGKPIAEYHATQCTPSVEVYASGTEYKKYPEYHQQVEAMVNDESRNTLIRGVAIGEALEGRKVLVLTKRIEHYKKIGEKMPDNNLIKYIESDDKDRNDLLMRLKDGDEDFSIIFGTTSLLAVGTDIPSLDTLIIACDMKEEVLTTQSVGRILRFFEGKPDPKVIDIMDEKHPIFNNQFRQRLKLYQAKGWKVKKVPHFVK